MSETLSGFIFVIFVIASLCYKTSSDMKRREKRDKLTEYHVYSNLLNQCLVVLSLLEHHKDEILSYKDETLPAISEKKIYELRKIITAKSYALSHILLTLIKTDLTNNGFGADSCIQTSHEKLITLSLHELYGEVGKQYDISSGQDRYREIFCIMHKISGLKFKSYVRHIFGID
ncbi:MAG: hypothetical protein NTY00_01240 [Deltaproteobacteria bacterium]|nr:hypothetical protein [Deltaproteobacteria bacterium]